MNSKSIFSKVGSLYTFATLAAILAAASLYFCFIDDFSHSLVLLFDYLLMFILVSTAGSAFKKGEKEVFKAATASIFTLAFLVFVRTFIDIIHLKNYYLFSANVAAIAIGITAILVFLFFTLTYINHFVINTSSVSSTKLVNKNKGYLIFIAILCLLEAALIAYDDKVSGRTMEIFLILTYVMYAFVSLMLATVEVLINNFRIAKESGKLKEFSKKLVGAKATNVATGAKKAKKPAKKKKK